MPRRVDHAARRAHITRAARELIATEGLRSATFERIAQMAGVSVRLLQYYFGTKAELLKSVHDAVLMDAAARLSRAVSSIGDQASTASRALAVAEMQLPADARSLADAHVLSEFHSTAKDRRTLPSPGAVIRPGATIGALASVIVAVTGGPQDDIRAEAVVAITGGLVSGILSGDHDILHATNILRATCEALYPLDS
jgi:TetR/AcrR family transcriptional repressor of bet genes